MGCTIETDKEWTGNSLPRLLHEDVLIAPGTPLAVVGLFLAALRFRFSDSGDGEPLPWYWDESFNLQPPEDCPMSDDGKRPLLIDAGFNVEESARNYRPAIYVDQHADVVPIKAVLDNRAGQNIPSGQKAYWMVAEMPLLILCEAEKAAESSIIADTVWFFLLATRDIFRGSFGLDDITEPTLSPTRPAEHDKTVWQTSVQFKVRVVLRWGTRPIAPLIADIAAKISEVGNSNLYYHQIALRDFK